MRSKGSVHIWQFIYLQCVSEEYDTVDDLRLRNVSGVFTTEKCTVANASKGGGTWVAQSFGGGGGIWTAVTATRTGNTTFTLAGDQTAIFSKGLIVRWLEGTTNMLGMVVSSAYTSVTTVTIIGDTCGATAATFKYCSIPVEIVKFVIAGTIGAAGTNVANAYYALYASRVIGADLQVGTAGTTNSTTVDINKGGTTMFTTKPALASTIAASTTPFTADSGTSLALNDKVTLDIDSPVQTTPAVDLYVQLYIFPTRLLNIS